MRGSRGRVHLCFHGIGTPVREREPGEAAYWVGVDDFRRLLDVAASWPDTMLSFDDGNRSDVDVALPELLDRGLTAWFYPLAGRLAQSDSLGPDDLRHLVSAGMHVGSHGMDHVPWRRLAQERVRSELVDARDQLADVLGAPVTRAALPLGRYDRRTLGHLRRLGYTRVATSDRRLTRDDSWLDHRFSVLRQDPVDQLQAAVTRATTRDGRTLLAMKGLAKRLQ